ncbi:MAG: hypothetical protein ABIR30_07955 [Chitinophagaceae bacterium]
MDNSTKKLWQEGYNRLKKAMEKIMKPKKQVQPQLVLQPVRNQPEQQAGRKYLRGTFFY